MSGAHRFGEIAADYASFRPHYPEALFDWLAEAAPSPEGRAAWDAGTGSGQAAVGLARHFSGVWATDASDEQLAYAVVDPRVAYRVAPAEASGLPDRSVDLVTAAQAVHWFDRPRFWAEARRVLRPHGVVAVWGYWTIEIAPEIDRIVRRFYEETVGPFWAPERRLIEARYRTIDFPFTEMQAPEFAIERTLTLDQVAGYIRTWSATRGYLAHHGRDPVTGLIADLAPVWGGPRARRPARWPLAVRAGRV